MKNSQLKSAFADSILTIAPLCDAWECFSDIFNYENPRQAILSTNRGNFTGDIYDARPILTPSEDFYPVISKFKLQKNTTYSMSIDSYSMVTIRSVIRRNSSGSLSFTRSSALTESANRCFLYSIHVPSRSSL